MIPVAVVGPAQILQCTGSEQEAVAPVATVSTGVTTAAEGVRVQVNTRKHGTLAHCPGAGHQNKQLHHKTVTQ